jgi:hypothetical protein
MSEETQKKESNVKSTIDAATGLVKAIPIYQDTVQPSAKQVGKSLETITKAINIALAPIKALVWGYEQIEQFVTTRVAEKLKNVKEENIVTPPPQVAGPAIEALRYSGHDENLRELFANLIATSMDKDTIDKAHPGYVEIIKNLSSDEALLLTAFLVRSEYPVIDVRVERKDVDGYHIVLHHYSHLQKIIVVKRSDLMPSYLDNLCRLGILEIPGEAHLTSENTYEPLENDEHIELYRKAIGKTEHEISFRRRLIQLTTFGEQFVENVVKEKK